MTGGREPTVELTTIIKECGAAMPMKLAADQRGFTFAELLVASIVTMLVLGGAVALTSQVQVSYRRQIEDAAAEQEGRYALEWVSRLIRSAGNNPYSLPPAVPPADPSELVPQCPPAPVLPEDPTGRVAGHGSEWRRR